MNIEPKNLANKIVDAMEDKKARDVIALEIKEITAIADYFIICSAGSSVQAQAIADNIEEKMDELGIAVRHKEGYKEANWILLDYGDVVAHVFQEDDRRFYNLEQLWGDAPAI